MRKQIKLAYPIVEANRCMWDSKEAYIYIKDQPDGKSIQVADVDRCDFTIENPKQKLLSIFAIDQCVFDHKSQHKKCDFAVFDNNIFAFVEIKDTYKRRPSHKKQAKQQLESTIIHFRKKINFDGCKPYAIISWRYRPVRPAVSTAMQLAKFEFLTKYNVHLVEGNKFEFN